MSDVKLIATRGLPASGKTSWSKQYQEGHPNVTRINRDDLRALLHGGVWSEANEKIIVKFEREIAKDALERGHTVIVDDTNLVPSTMTMWRQLAETAKVPFEIKDFTDVPWTVCVARNECRKNPVPMAAMKRMRKILNAEQEGQRHRYRPHDPKLPNAIMCDLDGTIAIINGRNPYDASTCDQDLVNTPVRYVLAMILHQQPREDVPQLIFMSARDDCHMDVTRKWLDETVGFKGYYELFMRATGDKRDDGIVKRELWEAHIKDKYNVLFVLDDRDRVVKTWRDLGLPTWQVAFGDF